MIWNILFLFLIQQTSTSTLEVDFFGVDRVKGHLMIELADGEGQAIQQKKHVISEKGTQRVFFEELKEGTYTIRAYWDENSNGKLDKGFFGEPTEKYGFSNDARGTFGPPDLQDQRFKVVGLTKTSIRLK